MQPRQNGALERKNGAMFFFLPLFLPSSTLFLVNIPLQDDASSCGYETCYQRNGLLELALGMGPLRKGLAAAGDPTCDQSVAKGPTTLPMAGQAEGATAGVTIPLGAAASPLLPQPT